MLAKYERTRAFDDEGFFLLVNFIRAFKKIVTTPNILTEVSNLSNKLSGDLRLSYFSSLAGQFELIEESYHPSSVLSHDPYFKKLGLTDSSIIQAAKNEYLVLTDDFILSNYLKHQGQASVNFNHLRQISWSMEG